MDIGLPPPQFKLQVWQEVPIQGAVQEQAQEVESTVPRLLQSAAGVLL